MEEDIYSKIAVLASKVEEHTKLLSKQQEKNDVQTELNTLTKIYVEESKETRKQMQKFSDTLDKVNDNLTSLNSKQSLLDDRVTGIEENLDKQNLSIIDIIKYVGATIFGLVVGYLAMKLGIK